MARLGKEHGAELAGADQAHGDRPPLGGALTGQAVQVHRRRSRNPKRRHRWRAPPAAAMLRAIPDGTTKLETEARMNEDQFNMEIRKFLKKVGVTSQREIERVVTEGIASGQLKGNETLKARVTLSIESLDLTHEIDGDISLE
jgi:hypothetical protein